MKFSGLLDLPHDENTRIIDLRTLRIRFPKIPEDVLRQLLSDHGRNDEFQSAYCDIDIDRVNWRREEFTAEQIINASMNPRFRQWFESVSARAQNYQSQGWKATDSRQKVREHWAEHQTWMVPPVLFSGSLVKSAEEFHLVEGHTRVGLLFGLVKHGFIESSSSHAVWLGSE